MIVAGILYLWSAFLPNIQEVNSAWPRLVLKLIIIRIGLVPPRHLTEKVSAAMVI